MSEESELNTVPGYKLDTGKSALALLPSGPLLAVGNVMAYGAAKYNESPGSEDNWRKGMAYRRVASAALRHIEQWLDREDLDPESGENHLAHAMCSLLFLMQYQITGRGIDDRPTDQYKEWGTVTDAIMWNEKGPVVRLKLHESDPTQPVLEKCGHCDFCPTTTDYWAEIGYTPTKCCICGRPFDV